jgi:dihydroorotate dehydrogenase electron transfer subunit
VELDIIHRVVGVGTEWLSGLKLGDSVSVLGTLGNKFELPPPGETAVLVAGGVGIPPMLYLAEKLKGRALAFCGSTSKDLLPFTLVEAAETMKAHLPANRVAEFNRYNVQSVVTTDDGSYGYGGYVTQALEKYLDEVGVAQTTIYTCGPELMMKRVGEIAMGRGIECQIAVERAMACGMGTCQSCCIRVRDGQGWRYRLACTDGPVFAASELLW